MNDPTHYAQALRTLLPPGSVIYAVQRTGMGQADLYCVTFDTAFGAAPTRITASVAAILNLPRDPANGSISTGPDLAPVISALGTALYSDERLLTRPQTKDLQRWRRERPDGGTIDPAYTLTGEWL